MWTGEATLGDCLEVFPEDEATLTFYDPTISCSGKSQQKCVHMGENFPSSTIQNIPQTEQPKCPKVKWVGKL